MMMAAGTIMTVPQLLNTQQLTPQPQKLPPLPAEKVKEFVAAGHNNLEKVKALLAEFPTLIYAT